MGRRAALAAVFAAALGLGMTGGHERARLSVGMNFKRVSAQHAGTIHVIATETCAPNLETNCAKNRVTADIVVQ